MASMQSDSALTSRPSVLENCVSKPVLSECLHSVCVCRAKLYQVVPNFSHSSDQIPNFQFHQQCFSSSMPGLCPSEI